MGLVKPARGWRVTDEPHDRLYDRLAGLWLFNEGSGTIVADASGHGRHGTANGTPGWIAGVAGWDYAVNRTDNAIAVANGTTSSTTGHTMVVRFRASGTTGGPQFLLAQHLNSAGSYGFAVWVNAAMAVSYRSGTGANAYVGVTADSIVAGDTWTHLTATYTSGMKRLYINGAEVTSGSLPQTTHTGTFYASATPLGIGNWEPNSDTAYGLSGAIDYAAIWSRALSAQEVRRLHEQPPWMVG